MGWTEKDVGKFRVLFRAERKLAWEERIAFRPGFTTN